jgi:hypothetical protein
MNLRVSLVSHRDPFDIPRAFDARYDIGGSREPCLEGTRAELLHNIYAWINPAEHQFGGGSTPTSVAFITSPRSETGIDQKRIFWLSGPAGSGKSAVSQSICMWTSDRHWLGTSFFFRRGDGMRGNASPFFSTIAHQLASFHPPLRALINEVIQADPDIFRANLETQYLRLLVEPFRILGDTFPSPTVVVDALDE